MEMKLNEIDFDEVLKIAYVDMAISTQMRMNEEAKLRLWKRLAAQFNFDPKTDLASVDNVTGIITISRLSDRIA